MGARPTREAMARELCALANEVHGNFKLGELYARMVNSREGAVGDATACRQMIEELLDDAFPASCERRVDQASDSTALRQNPISSQPASWRLTSSA